MIGGPEATPRADLERRLAALRAARRRGPGRPALDPPMGSISPGRDRLPDSRPLARALAAAAGGRLVSTARGTYVRVDGASGILPLDRRALAALPGLPRADVPLVCLDTETTGLATAPGTVAFLVGLGTWHGDRFDQVQLLLPDHSDEPALLDAIGALIPRDAWLVTYNGRGFDWPLLVARYRLARRDPPDHAGHLDLLSFVRRIFRHRLPDARLRTVERRILDLERHGDLEGWEIPRRYLDFLAGGSAAGLEPVVRHNGEDVRSLARLLALAATELGDPGAWPTAHPDDLAALAGVYGRAGRHLEAFGCLDAALGSPRWAVAPGGVARLADARRRGALTVARSRTLKRLGRHDEAQEAWRRLAEEGGAYAGIAWVELAKSLEHHAHDSQAALEAATRALAIVERARALDHPLPRLEADLAHRLRRLRRRAARRALARACASGVGPNGDAGAQGRRAGRSSGDEIACG